jgi:hypothetical protein
MMVGKHTLNARARSRSRQQQIIRVSKNHECIVVSGDASVQARAKGKKDGKTLQNSANHTQNIRQKNSHEVTAKHKAKQQMEKHLSELEDRGTCVACKRARRSTAKSRRGEGSVQASSIKLRVYKSVTRVLEECYKSVTRVLQECYKSVTRVLQECYKSVTRALQEC